MNRSPYVEAARRIAIEVAGPAADSVDREARFPREAIDALKEAKLLSAYVPQSLGGCGCTLRELAQMCEELGQRCSATAMVFAMHQIQVACILHHGASSAFFPAYLKDIAKSQRLIASVTSEAGVGGSVRTSISPVERDGTSCRLRKEGTVVSYADAADDFLITVRRAPDAVASDQVLVLVRRDQCTLEQVSDWDTLGMRGTCSPGYVLNATFGEEQIVPSAFAEINARTMVPFAHLLWGHAWLGIATDAVSRARAFTRAVARQMPGQTPPQAPRLAETSTTLHMMRSLMHDGVQSYENAVGEKNSATETFSSIGYAIDINEVKLASSRLVVDVVTQAQRVCGTAGYRNDSPYSVTRHLRDAHSAALMIGNDRINSANGSLLLVFKDKE